MAAPIDLNDAHAHLPALVDRAAAGEEIIIAKAGTPLARLLPFDQPHSMREPGGLETGLWIADDFDAPLPTDILAAFSGGVARPEPVGNVPSR